MPLKRCQTEDRPGWKWGDAGKCYVYAAGDEASETAARKKALAQAAAMGEFPGTGDNRSEISNPRGEPVEIRSAQVQSVDFAERVIELFVIPYGEETAKAEYQGQLITEIIEPGAFHGVEERNDHVTANREHDYGRTFGKVIEYRHDNPAGLIARVHVSETPLGDETLQLAADGVLKGSAGMVVRRRDQTVRNGYRRIRRAYLDHVALVPNPAYRGTGVLAVRQGQQAAEEVAPPTPNLDAILALLGE